jgi:hypothetical protein
MSVEAKLQAKDCLGVVDDATEESSKQNCASAKEIVARGILIDSLDVSIIHEFSHLDSAKEIWQTAKVLYGSAHPGDISKWRVELAEVNGST